ncbi:spectrin beta chain isoform X4 [Daphnia magna]|uniref:spectrin beta chain isoform X4 n=1 Tax=Daphnia magna TaxID=35525 RepID=UPI001E1BA9AD|nr:spectrin beta chain isoform X4 [Daphnia magna]
MDGDVTPDVVRVRAGTTANKRRSWHVARVAADIQRSLAEQSPARQPRFSWHPNDDCSLSYQQGSGWATTSDSDGKSDQVAQPRASFSIASWADRPVAKEMDSIIANYSSTPGVQREDSSFDEDDSPNDLVQPVFIVPIVLSTTEPPDVQVLNHNKRLNSTMSDNYIDVVVKELRDERESVQKKTFQKWVNSHLVRVGNRIGDLYTDLRDGKMLLKLLEVLSGERLPRPTKGKMRIHCLENVDKALQFLRDQRVHLENMGSHDIVDGSSRLTLGLIWTIILRFQIQDITIEETDNNETRSAKDALLLWCQMKTAGYQNVNIRNFTTSWRDGLAFNAIIHKHCPELVQYDKLSKSNAMFNLNNAFNVAEQKLGLTKLLDAEDIYVDQPDEKSIITYVVTYYHYFSKLKQETVQGKRIGKVVGLAMENDRMVTEYETLTSDLLRWIESTIRSLSERDFANSLAGVQQQLLQFNNYRTLEKPPKFVEKGNLEVLLFTLQSKMRANNQKPYFPKEGKMISDINKAWERLEKSEHERELTLREELIRQEKLEQLAARFDRKAGMRETWLSENQRLVSQDNFGFDLAAVEAAAKKHEAIETDILAYEERVQAVVAVAQELEAENYHDIDRINARKDNVLRLWQYLLELLRARRMRLELSLQLQQNFQEMLYILDSMEELKVRLLSEDYGKHLMGVEDLLQKHALVEADINVLGERVKMVVQHSQRFLETEATGGFGPCDPAIIVDRVQQLEDAYAELVKLAVERRARLEESRKLWQFYWDMADEENWIKEKEHILSTGDIGHDLTTIHLLISKHKALEEDIASHEPTLYSVVNVGEELIQQEHFGSEKIQERITEMVDMWNHLCETAAYRRKRLEEAVSYHQFFTDADDVDTWMLDVLRLVSSEDVGRDEANVQSLLKKHKDVTEELKNYASTIDALKEQSEELGEQDRTSPEVVERLASIERRYRELMELAKLRKQRLLDALSLYKLFSEADGVEQWIGEKERMLETMVPAKDIEDVEVMRHRYDGFDREMNANASRVAVVNQLARQLLHVEHPNSEDIVARQNQLNARWAELRDRAEAKRDELQSAHGVQTFHIECRETILWIEDKIRILQSTDSLEMDLTGIMTLQRRLSGMERDLAAIQAKLDSLDKEAEKIGVEHPEEEEVIRERLGQIRSVWENLTQMLKERDAKLEEAGDLHRFLRDLDHFQTWLTKTQTDVASEDIPASLAEAEKLLSQHQGIREEIDNYTDDYSRMMDYGERITAEETTSDDPQYMFLRERLKALRDGWEELHQMWENRQQLLSQSLNLQMFLRDAKQAEVLLAHQEHVLSKDEMPANLEQAENAIKRHEAFLTTMDANDDKVNNVIQFAQRLEDEGHFAADKAQKKAENISERREANRQRAVQLMEKLRDALQLQQFLQDCEELSEWIQEKNIIAQDETYRSAKTVHSKWTRHQAFEAEIASNKDRLYHIQQAGEQLIKEKPEIISVIDPRIQELSHQFDDLERTTREKGERLFDANRQVLYEQTCDDIDTWMSDLEKQMVTGGTGEDLASVNILMQKQQMIETQMAIKAQQVSELGAQAEYLERMTPEKVEDIQQKKEAVERRFDELKAPLVRRQRDLEKKKEAYQFRRDVEDEKLWISDKMPLATASDYGNSLFNVNVLKKKNQSLRTEIDNHEQRIHLVCNNGQKLIDEDHADSQEFSNLIEELLDTWQILKDAMDNRRANLLASERAQQYFFDASEAESWMSEQELYMMVEDRGKDEISAQNLMKKHQTLELAVEDYAETIRSLGETSTQLIAEGHPDSDQIAVRQAQVDKLYAGLRDLAQERRAKLEEALQLFMLSREVDDLRQWIADREVVAGSHELGQDYDHVTLLWERFKEFARDTETIGTERVAAVNEIADQLMGARHSDAATIAEWKDDLNEAWADLLELIDTRTQMLAASRELHKFFHDCKDVLGRIVEKQNTLSDELGRDAGSVSALQRKHQNFIQDLQTLQSQVQGVQEDSQRLQAAYAGDKAREITGREGEVVNAWLQLQALCEGRRQKLADTGDLFRFFSMVRTLVLWIDDLIRQMNTTEKPRDVSGVELLMNNHQSLKAEIDARGDNFSACIALGKELLSRGHYATNEIKEKLVALTNQRNSMLHRWEERWEHLQLILEVYQFARDAAVAEGWLMAQESYLMSHELGHTIDEVENLIKKHEAFEKSAAAQEERFAALERLTTMEWILHGDGGGDLSGALVDNHPSWHPGYFHPVVDSPFRSLLRSISDQTPSPACIKELFEESTFHDEDGPFLVSNNSSASSSPHLSRLSHSSCVSDTSASSASSSNASASGDKLKKRRKYRKKRGVKRQNMALSFKNSQDGCSGKAESPSAVYCEEWIYSTSNQPEVNKRLTFAGLSEAEQSGFSDELPVRRNSLDSDVKKKPKKNTSWLNMWQNLLRITPKPMKKAQEPIAVEINPAVGRISTLPSISEAGPSETQSVHSNPSTTNCSVALSSASGSLTACNVQTNTTSPKYELKELKRRQEEDERQRAEELAAQQAALAAIHSPPEGSNQDQTDGDTSPSEPISGSTDKDPTTEATEGRASPKAEQAKPAPVHAKVETTSSPSYSAPGQTVPVSPSSPADSSTKRRSSLAGGDDVYEGTVNRKHEWESTTKKASNRSWDKVYLTLRQGDLAVYKDQKCARAAPEVYHRNESPLDIRTAVAEVAADYTKKRHVFRLKLANGGEYLFQAKDDEEMNGWVTKLQASTNAAVESASAGSSRAQTMPAQATKDEPKKRSFFTLKKK